MNQKFTYLLYLLLLSVACSSPKKTAESPAFISLSDIYNPSNTNFHPAYTIYHNSSTASLLLVKIFPSELLYSGIIEPNKLLGQVSLSYEMKDITDPESTVIADSGVFVHKFPREDADKRYMTQIPLKTEPGKRYQLKLLAKDVVRNEENLVYLHVDRSSYLSEQNFMVYDVANNVPFFKPYVIGNSIIRLQYWDESIDTIYVLYYGKDTPIAKPSFTLTREREFLEKPDSLWIMPFSKDNNYQLNYEGIYHFQFDTNQIEGLTLYNFGENYPRIKEISQLIEPLAYLATSAEYDDILKASNQKLAVDNFWLDKAKEAEKARELIRIYYNRVYFANYYFTSFKPGWKTDRGMIFIMYGPPQSVNVTPGQEKWIYFKNNFNTTVTFTFNYVRSPFTLDNYVLQPSENFDSYWRSAVDTWRRGNIFIIE